MKKEEVSGLMLRIYNCMDQAELTDTVEKLMSAAPVQMQKEFIKDMLENSHLWDNEPDEDDVIVAKRLVRYDDET